MLSTPPDLQVMFKYVQAANVKLPLDALSHPRTSPPTRMAPNSTSFFEAANPSANTSSPLSLSVASRQDASVCPTPNARGAASR